MRPGQTGHTNLQQRGSLAVLRSTFCGLPFHSGSSHMKGRTMTSKLALVGAVLALAPLTPPAIAQSNGQAICGQRDAIINTLSSRYGETARSIGMGPGNRIVEVYASDETGTWTITVTSADGLTCLMASGASYETLIQPAPGEPL